MTDSIPDPAVPVRPEQRSLPRSMVTVVVLFSALFALLVVAMITTVLADDTPEPPALADLPLPAAVQVVDSMPTCTDAACDGQGVVLIGADGEGVVGRVAQHWRDSGWDSLPCTDEGTMCFADDDLRISLSVWSEVNPLQVPKLWESVADEGLDPGRLVYVHYFRCGPIFPCN